MTERTRKIIDSAWIPVPETDWRGRPGEQVIAAKWHYPRWGCDTVQHMVDLMDDLVQENDVMRRKLLCYFLEGRP